MSWLTLYGKFKTMTMQLRSWLVRTAKPVVSDPPFWQPRGDLVGPTMFLTLMLRKVIQISTYLERNHQELKAWQRKLLLKQRRFSGWNLIAEWE